MTDQEKVLKVLPTAFDCFDQDRRKFKVYYMINDCRVALSSSWDTKSMAWAEAAKNVEPRTLQQEVHEAALRGFDDGRGG